MLVENNPKRFKHQAAEDIRQELEKFCNDKTGDENLLVLLGEAGSGKSLALQLRFIKEIEEWKYGEKALPVFFNMADEVDLEKVIIRINSVLGCNINLNVASEEIHLFIDSYDEGRPAGEINRSGEQKMLLKQPDIKEASLKVEEYFKLLKSWRRRKIIISCRTDFVQRDENDDDLSEFKVSTVHQFKVRYIAPITYHARSREFEKKGINNYSVEKEKNSKSVFHLQVQEWLKREKIEKKPEEIITKISRLGVEERMRTGLVFNMIMKMLVSIGEEENLQDLWFKGFEIYRRTIREEFKQNIPKFIPENDSITNAKLIIREEIKERFDLDLEETLSEEDEIIYEAMERVGELLATEMNLNKTNRITFKQAQSLLAVKSKDSRFQDFVLDQRTEWTTLYQMLRIMGMKLERRKPINNIANQSHINTNQMQGGAVFEPNQQTIDVGFRHETYKNYFLLRGLKRLLPTLIIITEEEIKQKLHLKDRPVGGGTKLSTNIAQAFLDDGGVISNYELLKFCGEEVLNYKDARLRQGLRKLLQLEQAKNRMLLPNPNKTSPSSLSIPQQHPSQKVNISRAAVIISLLVAGGYQFFYQDLSDLHFAGAYMRGGDFFGSKFENTDLKNANLRHADISHACFKNADLRGLHMGVFPDLIGHNDFVTSVLALPNFKRSSSDRNEI